MSVQILPTSKKYFRQLKNGDDFLLNTSDFSNEIKGNISGKVRAEFEIEVSWRAVLENYTIEQVSGTDAVINLGTTNVFQFGFTVGDHASLIANSGTFFAEFDIVAISQDGSILNLENVATIATFSALTVGIKTGPSTLRGETPLLGAAYKTNIITNDGITVFSSLIDQVEGTYNVDALVISTPKAAIWGNVKKGSQTGGLTVEYKGAVTDGGTFDINTRALIPNSQRPSIQKYIFKEDLIAGPYFLQGEDGISTGIEPDRLDSTSLKHVVEFDLRHTLSQVNTSKVLRIDEQNDGVVNYYKATYNDQPNQYSVSNVVIQDVTNSVSLDKVDVTVTTRINCQLNSDLGTFTSGQPLVLIHSMLPDASVYGNSTETFEETWLTDHARHVMDGTGANFGVIQNFTATNASNNVTNIQFDLIYNSTQQNRITEGDKYAIAIELENDLLTTNTSDTTPLPINVDTYLKNADNPNVWFVDRARFFTRPMTFTGAGIEDGFSNLKLWNQDSFMVDWAARLDRLNEDGVLTGLSVSIVAIHDSTNDFFVLDEVIYDLSDQIVVNGTPTIQNISIDGSRGFRANDGDKVNFEKLQTGLLVGDDQNYTGQTGFIIPWQTWQKLQDADTAFLLATEPNDNLNKQTSNYSGLLNYNIKLIIEATVTDTEGAATRVVDKTPVCSIKNFFDQDGTPRNWTTQEQTFKLSGPNTNQTVLKTENTRLVFTFTPDVPFVIDGLLYYAEVRAEPVNNRGADYHYLTTFQAPPSDNFLQPEDGESFAKLTVTGCCIEISCLSSFENLDPLLDYNFYCKISLFDQSPPIVPTINRSIDFNIVEGDQQWLSAVQTEVMPQLSVNDNMFGVPLANINFRSSNVEPNGDQTIRVNWDIGGVVDHGNGAVGLAALAAVLGVNSAYYFFIETSTTNFIESAIEFIYEALGSAVQPQTILVNFGSDTINNDFTISSNSRFHISNVTPSQLSSIKFGLRTSGPDSSDWTDFVHANAASFNLAVDSLSVDDDMICHFHGFKTANSAGSLLFDITYLDQLDREKNKNINPNQFKGEWREFDNPNGCIEFDHTNNAVNLGPNIMAQFMDIDNAVTVEYWFEAETAFQAILSNTSTFGGQSGVAVSLINGDIQFQLNDGGNKLRRVWDATAEFSGGVSTGMKYHLIITKTTSNLASGLEAYLQGRKLTDIINDLSEISAGTTVVPNGTIMCHSSFQNSLVPAFTQANTNKSAILRIYDRVLTAEEIRKCYLDIQAGASYTGLIRDYDFSGVNSSTLTDLTGNEDGTLINHSNSATTFY